MIIPDERPEITVKPEDGESRGRYVGKIAGIDAEGEITFTRRRPDLISADHTGAPDELKGSGLAAAMVEYRVAGARARAFKVIPICPMSAPDTESIWNGATFLPSARAKDRG